MASLYQYFADKDEILLALVELAKRRGESGRGRLAEMGAMLERAFTTPHTGKVSWERVFEATGKVVAKAKYSRVVGCIKTDNQVWIIRLFG